MCKCPKCGEVGIPFELKATFKSGDKGIEDEDSWLKQVLAQCYVTKTNQAFLTRLELAGNWKSIFGKKEEKDLPENRKPTLHAFQLEFTQEELDENWAWLLDRRNLFKKILDEGKLLSKGYALPPNHEWEAGYCKYKEICGQC